MLIDFNLPIASICLLALALISFLIIAFVYCRRLLAVRDKCKNCDADAVEDAQSLPKVAVIVHAFDEPEALKRTLGCLVTQEYAPGYKIIVVNDGSSADVNMAAGMVKALHPNIYVTYTPQVARNVCRKKLALTIGIKAADPDSVIVVVDAHTVIESDQWLRQMAKHFVCNDVEMVLGYGATQCRKPVPAFDAVADSATWIYAAIKGKPYRGCGYNLAYRRSLFFNNNGFARSLDLKNGDDDIFVHSLASGDNTALELSKMAQVYHVTHYPKREMRDFRTSHAFTGRRLPRGFRRVNALCEWLMWVVCAASVAGALLAPAANLAGWIVAAVLIIAMLATTAICWRKCASALSVNVPAMLLPWLAMTRPLRNAAVNLRSRSKSQPHFSWQ